MGKENTKKAKKGWEHPHTINPANRQVGIASTLGFLLTQLGYQYGRNEDKVLKCTNIPSDIDSIHNRRPKPSFGDIWSTARVVFPERPPFWPKLIES